jgi:flagellar biosynthesis/type III secretory pathway chaperone
MSDNHFAYFIETLETLENLLHAETQAIAAKSLDTIDDIMRQKDVCLKSLLSAKELLSQDPKNNQLANEKIDFVMNLQSRNAASFSKLKDQVATKQNPKVSGKVSSTDKARDTYLGN